jgi:protein O-mannosyl-transferase
MRPSELARCRARTYYRLTMPPRLSSPWSMLAGLAAVLGACWLAYLPGLSGGFLFDDLINIDVLGKRGPIEGWPAFWRYITSGAADPTGRPLALLSFLLDARDWPADPHHFLRTNLLLHLLNGTLLFVLLRALERHLDGPGPRTEWAALLGAGIWLLHPLFVSTTLYIVQREAMLPASFVLGGLLAYVHGRRLYVSRPRAGGTWMLVGIGVGTLLAVLSKANGILLPLLALVLEATVLRAGNGPGVAAVTYRLRWWRRLLLVLPALLIVAYLARYLLMLHEPIDVRSWTIAERLMTQPRVLLDYLQLLLVPRVLSTGLYNDAYTVSTGWFVPWTTLPAALAIVALAVCTFTFRRRWPVLSAGVLFWLAGHLLESSIVPLELYFEHRNYLPAMLLFWPLARALVRWRAQWPVRAMAGIALLALLGGTTWQRATLWGQPDLLAAVWAMQNPDSPRAQATAAMAEMRAGRPDLASRRLAPLVEAAPAELQGVLNLADARCMAGGLDTPMAERVSYAMRHSSHGQHLAWRWLDGMLDRSTTNPCPGIDTKVLQQWIEALAANPAMTSPGRRQDAAALAGRLALLMALPDRALAHFDRGLAADPRPDAAAQQAAQLARHGHYAQALAHLDHYERLAALTPPEEGLAMPRLHRWVLDRQGYWRNEFNALRRQLRAELDATGVPTLAPGNTGDAPPAIRHTPHP